MIVHVTYDYLPDSRDEVQERFKQTGAPPPDGVTMIGRWHAAEGNRGWLVAETDEPDAIARWLQEWTDLISFEVTLVLTDEQFRAILD